MTSGASWDQFLEVVRDSCARVTDAPIGQIQPSDHLLDDLGLDSFGVLVVVADLEDAYDVTFPAANDEPTVGNLYRLVMTVGTGAVDG